MRSADLIVSNCHQLLTCEGPLPKRKEALQDVGLRKQVWIASHRGKIVFIGSQQEFEKGVKVEQNAEIIDGRKLVALPGFVDSHTHLPFAGTREEEFLLRLKGYSYQQLAEKGLGIQTTVKATRKASREELVFLCLERLDSMLRMGTTMVEAKSGYGLNLQDEIKQLQAIKEANQIHPVDVVATFMGAHEVPPEYKKHKNGYIELLIHEIMPEVRKRNLAEFFDVFCEESVYSVAESRKLIRAAKKESFKIRIHADEFSALGGAELAVEEGAFSADHLLAVTETGIKKLAASKTAATLLPAVPFFLRQKKQAPARQLIDEGAIVALATDFNPGSSMTESMLFVLQLAVFTMKMSVEEALNAATANASYALGRDKEVGSLEVGKKMDLILAEIPNYAFLFYHLGVNPIKYVIKNGKVVVKEGKIVRPS